MRKIFLFQAEIFLSLISEDFHIFDQCRLDKQYFGMTHPEEAKKKEKQFHERNAQYLSSDLPDKFEGMVYSNEKDFVQYRKDKVNYVYQEYNDKMITVWHI